jgi:hypothetical protein
MPKKKYFSPREVDHLIPQLETIFDHLSVCKGRAEALATEGTQAPSRADTVELVQVQLTRSQVEFLMEAVQDDIDHILHLGGVTKDLEAGLVDFPGQVEGEEVWLCWKRGETKVRFWHPLNAGFSQRQALRRPDTKTMYH